MVVHQIVVQHNGTPYPLQFDTDNGLEVLRYQLFSLTFVPPEKQKIVSSSDKPLVNESDLLNIPLSDGCRFTLHEEDDGDSDDASTAAQDTEAILKADEELARSLQAEEEAIFYQQQRDERGLVEFQRRIEPYISQVMQYEEPLRQDAARRSVPQHELEENAAIALAKEGKKRPTQLEMDYAFLLQLLFWFKKSFRWINAPCCLSCGAETSNVGMGQPNSEELKYGGNRIEIYRCQLCEKLTRFPRYNDPLKLIETRSGRCGEWANCFTLYCRALGYQSRLVLDLTDHMWTECFSEFLGRWMHLDPCEATFDKPLLYEEGWGKKLNYIIALSKDGVYDVTKRYTRHWDEVLRRRIITSEHNANVVITNLTSFIRRGFPSSSLPVLQVRDKQEAEEIQRAQHEYKTSSEAFQGRQSGAKEWRIARGEFNATESAASHMTCPLRLCVDEHVSKVSGALGLLCIEFCRKESLSRLKKVLKELHEVLHQLKAAPFKARKVKINLLTDPPSFYEDIGAATFQKILCALHLKQMAHEAGDLWICLGGDPIETALAIPVALEQIKSLCDSININTSKESSGLERLRFLTENERLFGGTCQASGEEPPLGISSSAFDGLHSTKWEDPSGAKGSWIICYFPDGVAENVTAYDLTSANDCPERDPMNWKKS
eukprot:c28155_g1_i2 orf=70-2052(+)